MKSFNPIKHILQEQLDQLPLIKQRGEKRIGKLNYLDIHLLTKTNPINRISKVLSRKYF